MSEKHEWWESELAYMVVANQINIDFNAQLKVTCSCAPVQIEGLLSDGRYLYFRCRHEGWQFHVGNSKDAMFEQMQPDLFFMEGETESYASMVDPREALQLLTDGLTWYKARP